MRWVYSNDKAYNAFPSGHVYFTTLIALFWARWYPRWRWVWAGSVVVVGLATLFTHQHYLLDPVGGLTLAWIGYRLSWRLIQPSSQSYHPVLKAPPL